MKRLSLCELSPGIIMVSRDRGGHVTIFDLVLGVLGREVTVLTCTRMESGEWDCVVGTFPAHFYEDTTLYAMHEGIAWEAL